MYCYKNGYKGNAVYHYIETMIDDDIKCLCGKKFQKHGAIVTKNRPKELHNNSCVMCEDNLVRFWRENVKVLTKVEGTSLHRIGDSDNMVYIKKEENARATS